MRGADGSSGGRTDGRTDFQELFRVPDKIEMGQKLPVIFMPGLTDGLTDWSVRWTPVLSTAARSSGDGAAASGFSE